MVVYRQGVLDSRSYLNLLLLACAQFHLQVMPSYAVVSMCTTRQSSYAPRHFGHMRRLFLPSRDWLRTGSTALASSSPSFYFVLQLHSRLSSPINLCLDSLRFHLNLSGRRIDCNLHARLLSLLPLPATPWRLFRHQNRGRGPVQRLVVSLGSC